MTADFSGLIGKVFTATQVSKGTVGTGLNNRVLFTEVAPLANVELIPSVQYGPDTTLTVTNVTVDSGFTNIFFLEKIPNPTFPITDQPVRGTVFANDGTDFILNQQGAGFYLFTNSPAQQPGVGNTLLVSNSASNVVYTPPCFCAGTRIGTPTGECAVEQLAVGDLVLTHRHKGVATRRVIWLGHREVDCTTHPQPQLVWPIRVRKDAFGLGRPWRDLFLSPEHAIFHGGVLIPVQELVDGHNVQRMPRDHVTYWHVELEEHDVLLADGLAAESYLENGNRTDFAEVTVISLHPQFQGSPASPQACAPLRRQGEAVQAVRALLARNRVAPEPLATPRKAFEAAGN